MTFRRAAIAALSLLLISLAGRLLRLLRAPARVIAALILMTGLTVILGALILGAKLTAYDHAIAYAIVVLGIVLVESASSKGADHCRSITTVLDRRRHAPRSIVSLRVRAVLADVVVDLTSTEVPAKGAFVSVTALASRVEVLVSEDLRGEIFEIEIDAPYSPPPSVPLRLFRRRYLGSAVEVTYVPELTELPSGRS